MHADGHARPRDQHLQHVANRHGAARADVVGPARTAAFRDHRSTHDGVADVGQIPPRLEVADADLGRLQARLDLRDLPGESRRGERGILPGTEVVERARDGDLHPRSGAWLPTSSCASLLKPYGLAGTSGWSSVSGSVAGR